MRGSSAHIPLALLSLALTVAAATAEPWQGPRTTSFRADWQAARAEVPVLPSAPLPRDPLAALTEVVADVFPSVGRSPVPVLLPFAAADYAHDRAADQAAPAESYLFDFEATRFFLVGPTGYDAAFAMRTRAVEGLQDIGFAHPVVVHISAFTTLYDVPLPQTPHLRVAPELEKQFPGLRRQLMESTVRYGFERFGIPYVVSIQCFDGPQRRLRLSCSHAERVATRFLSALRLAGGHADAAPSTQAPDLPARPDPVGNAFAYHPPGQLWPGTAMRATAGDADRTVYARIRFPVADAPAFLHSERFGRRRAQAPTPPGVSGVWRDNFCERRHFYVARCPSGLGHQGQDIRGPGCDPASADPHRCRANTDAVVAARNGMILREAWNDSVFLVTNETGERLRFRYLHMHPRRLDDDGIVSGRRLREGERLGTIGNYSRRAGLTSTHLHFEVQVPTRAGWMRVNPYMTLVAAYETLVGARGVEIEDTGATEVAAAEVVPAASKPKAKARKLAS